MTRTLKVSFKLSTMLAAGIISLLAVNAPKVCAAVFCTDTHSSEVFEEWFGVGINSTQFYSYQEARRAVSLAWSRATRIGYTDADMWSDFVKKTYDNDSIYRGCIRVVENKPLFDNSIEGLLKQLQNGVFYLKRVIRQLKEKSGNSSVILVIIRQEIKKLAEALS